MPCCFVCFLKNTWSGWRKSLISPVLLGSWCSCQWRYTCKVLLLISRGSFSLVQKYFVGIFRVNARVLERVPKCGRGLGFFILFTLLVVFFVWLFYSVGFGWVFLFVCCFLIKKIGLHLLPVIVLSEILVWVRKVYLRDC